MRIYLRCAAQHAKVERELEETKKLVEEMAARSNAMRLNFQEQVRTSATTVPTPPQRGRSMVDKRR